MKRNSYREGGGDEEGKGEAQMGQTTFDGQGVRQAIVDGTGLNWYGPLELSQATFEWARPGVGQAIAGGTDHVWDRPSRLGQAILGFGCTHCS